MATLGGTLAGAGSGAATGAAIGSVIPGLGTAIGGIAGGLIGGIGGALSNAGAAPTAAPVVSPYTAQDAQNATQTSQLSAQQQQAFLQQLQAQNGIQNQQAVFNQLQNVANGQGPNPAQAMLANATGANVAQQAALMAGQRGAGANVGLESRQIAQQGANTQQQAAGQGAAMQAQQSLGALGQLGGIAGQQVGQQQNALQQLQAANQAQQNAQLNSLQGVNSAVGNAQTPLNQIAANNTNNQINGALGGAGAALGAIGRPMANTPVVQQPQAGDYSQFHNGDYSTLAKGGEVTPPKAKMTIPGGPRSYIGKHQAGTLPTEHIVPMSQGGKVDAMVSPGEKYLPPAQAQAVAQGKADPIKEGQTIPGKAKVKGDSLKNDIVPAALEEGGCVIPRSVLEGPNPHEAAARFVAEHMSKRGKR